MTQTINRPLEGVRILDFTRVLSGPFCTAMLADIGAEVIKIESPTGDDQRHMGAMRHGQSVSFELINRNKKSLCLDLKSPEAKEVILDLVASCDVVVENFRPGVAARLGVDYDTLRRVRPDLIHCAISGFGQEGPLTKRPAYDVVAQAMSGFMSLTGEPGRPPVLAGDSIGDTVPGIYAAWAICAALFRRERTGQGGEIDVAMFDCLFSLLPTALAQFQTTGTAPERTGSTHPLSAPFGAFQAQDGHFVLAVANAPLFARLSEALGLPDLPSDPRFVDDQKRRAHEDDLRAIIEGWSADKPVAEVIDLFEAKGIPAAPIWNMAEAAASPQVAVRDLLSRQVETAAGPLDLPEQPVQFVGCLRGGQKAAPRLGADEALRAALDI